MGIFDWFFAFCAKRAFQQVDSDGNGKLNTSEVEVAILHVCNVVNKRLPGWQDPPSTRDIKRAVDAFGQGLGFLDEKTFVEFSKSLIKNGPSQFFKRVGTNAVLKTGVMPGITHLIKKHAGNALRISGVPDVVLAPAISALTGVARGLLPFG